MASIELDLTSALWRRSSYSNGTGGECVEVASAPGVIPVRDSKTAPHNGPVLLFQAGAWAAFLTEVKAG